MQRAKAGFSKVRVPRTYQAVVEQIEGMIERGELAPGDVLPSEREMAAMLGVSRGVLAQAFRVLEENGVVEVAPGSGRFVRSAGVRSGEAVDVLRELQKAAILDLLEVRETLERTVVELACLRATEADLAEIERLLASPIGGTPDGGADDVFHLAVARATHNAVLKNIVRLTLGLIHKTRERLLPAPGRSEEMASEHRAIFEAIKSRDVRAAREAVERHLRSIRAHLADGG